MWNKNAEYEQLGMSRVMKEARWQRRQVGGDRNERGKQTAAGE